jgi:hypothetical protein
LWIVSRAYWFCNVSSLESPEIVEELIFFLVGEVAAEDAGAEGDEESLEMFIDGLDFDESPARFLILQRELVRRLGEFAQFLGLEFAAAFLLQLAVMPDQAQQRWDQLILAAIRFGKKSLAGDLPQAPIAQDGAGIGEPSEKFFGRDSFHKIYDLRFTIYEPARTE